MKVIRHEIEYDIPLPNGQVRHIKIPQIEVIDEQPPTRHRTTKHFLPRVDLLPKPDRRTKIAIIGVLVAAMLGIAALTTPSSKIYAAAMTKPKPETRPNLTQPLDNQPGDSNQNLSPDCQLSPLEPDSISQWESQINSACEQTGVPADLLGALIAVESGGNPNAVSKDLACGLTQVVSNSNQWTNEQGVRLFANRPSCQELTGNPQFAVNYGAQFLRSLYDRYGNWRDALYAYGPTGIGYTYADMVLSKYQAFGH
jgi:hypothetical protein